MRSYQEITVRDSVSGLTGYLVVNASDKDISFGGTRIDMSVTREMVVELADNMSLKLAVHESPVGGAKAGICASPDDPRLAPFLNQFAVECRELLTSNTILGKDMGAKQWMLDEIYKSLQMPQLGLAQKRFPAANCPDRLFELNGYISNMTGKGVFWSIEQALGGVLRGSRVLIQGFGVVGSGVASHLYRSGAKIVGVSDSEKAVLGAHGLDVNALVAAKNENGLLATDKLPGSCVLAERDGLLLQPADVLVLAAGSYLVDAGMAARISAGLVVEGANLALMPSARKTLHANGIRVIPDIVANSASAALVGHQIAAGNTLDPQALWVDIESNIRRGTAAAERLSKHLDIDSKSAFRHTLKKAGTVEVASYKTQGVS